jgi:hypothetical protein
MSTAPNNDWLQVMHVDAAVAAFVTHTPLLPKKRRSLLAMGWWMETKPAPHILLPRAVPSAMQDGQPNESDGLTGAGLDQSIQLDPDPSSLDHVWGLIQAASMRRSSNPPSHNHPSIHPLLPPRQGRTEGQEPPGRDKMDIPASPTRR